MHWRAASEISAGLVLRGRISPNEIDVSLLHPPYDRMVHLAQEGKGEVDMLDACGMEAIYVAKEAADACKGDPYPYVELLHKSAVRAQVGERLAPIVKKLERGEEVDSTNILSLLARLDTGYTDFTPAGDIPAESSIYIPSFYKPLDENVGGFPGAGLTLVAGVTGTGKTTFLLELAKSAARNKKRCAILTLEMTMNQLVHRLLEVAPDLTEKQKQNILLAEDVYTVDEVYAAANRAVAKYPGLHFIGIDYADMMVADREQSEPVMGRVYTSMALLAKKTKVPVVLITQYRRLEAGQMPTIEDIRYSGRAEQAASMILLLHNPDLVWSRTRSQNGSNPLPHIEGMADIIVGKLRYKGKQSGMGAITVQWDKERGRWGSKGMWRSLNGKI